MDTRRRVEVGAVLALVCAGCCPCGIDEDTVKTPNGAFLVVDSDSGAPIEGATVVVRRFVEYPHYQPEFGSVWSAQTDGVGKAGFEHAPDEKTVFPLMMHGVSGFGWGACVRAPGHQTVRLFWFREGDSADGVAWEDVLKGTPLPVRKVSLGAGESVPCSTEVFDRRIRKGEEQVVGADGA